VTSTRLSIAAHRAFPGQLLDGAMPNGDSGLLVASGMSDFGRALMAAERDNSQALLLFTPTVEDVSELLAESHRTRPEMALIVALPGPGNGSIGAALKAGAHEIVLLPAESTVVTAAVHKALARVTQDVETPRAVSEQPPLLVVLGPKGGVGKTTVSTNLAVDLVGRGHSTLLIDLDLQFGDVGIALGVEPDRTIWDLVSAPGRLDGERLRAFLGRSADGVHVLLAPVRPDQAEVITPERLDEVLEVARAEFDVVIADTPPAFTPTSILAIDRADQAIMIGTLDLSGIKNMKIGLETLELMGTSRDSVLMVLNRADSKVGLTMADVKSVLSRAPEVEVPSDRALPRSLNAARPIIASEPKSAPAKSFRDLGDRVVAAVLQPKDA
jgi:pilus assembly protein CpaE